MRRILAGYSQVEFVGINDVPGYPEPVESGATFAENALIKAWAGVRHTGLITVADDSGLAVDALGGMPGVLSARWAGRRRDDAANLNLVLDQLADVPAERRGAAFVCAAAVATPAGAQRVTHGLMRGRIVDAPAGAGGFGYDPIFIAEGQTKTNAELTAAEKDALSHRGQAFAALAAELSDLLGGAE
ncbi:MAG: RdgB/HAM1 family non-canonical purine NTP pyrophosphatase [Actinomycetota bacterium]|nr:RdgB/HAM1 family non-canonical purine NTP pyrophosphatase [Actinomycetota bacterium]